ncbi:CARDB domain-containing protein [Desulfoluna sp.]|uniref:CARDB domain-containing protein n=1 Tax=Desulfoluna sp. TaxID=2045199 RepID=UPI002619DF9B|nr:CARDB domain-containing protein [Desulfoluna sp.]
MISHSLRRATVLVMAILLLATQAFSEVRYDRDLVVKDETRADKVEIVFKKLIAAYEDEDPQGFLDLVSDDRFRQDYITFTDALYSDFRKYEIHRVDYWVDRVVPDHIKQFLFVKWEKRYETLENGRQKTLTGYSRFLFDEVNGKYLLIELAGTPLFGGSLQEWRKETPPISGQALTVAKAPSIKIKPGPDPTPKLPEDETGDENPCSSTNLDACRAQADCEAVGGYWYNGMCNSTQQDPAEACLANNGYWYNNTCNNEPGLPDLEIIAVEVDYEEGKPQYTIRVRNNGPIESQNCDINVNHRNFDALIATGDVSPIQAGDVTEVLLKGSYDDLDLKSTVNSQKTLQESRYDNNTFEFKVIPY